jgi:hypothetical protein
VFIGHFALGFAAKRAVPHVSLAVLVTATFALVLSHWFLDFATHRPEMPLYPEGPKVGLGLWNSIPATMATELLMYAAGVWIYFRATRATDGIGRCTAWIWWADRHRSPVTS